MKKIFHQLLFFNEKAMSRSEEDSCSSSEDEEITVDEEKVQDLESKVCKIFIRIKLLEYYFI